MALDSRPARPLTSREIAKILSALVGGLISDWCDPEEVVDAFDHFAQHRSDYLEIWKEQAKGMKALSDAAKQPKKP